MATRTICTTGGPLSLTLLLLVTLLAPLPADAQQTDPSGTPEAPAPSECTVEPRALPLLAADASSTVSPAPSTGSTATPPSQTEGDPAEPAVAAGVTATVRESLACRNAGDFSRAYALVTDHFLLHLFGGAETIDPQVAAALEAEPVRVRRGERLHLVAVSEVRVLADGRVGAVVTTSGAGAEWRDYLIFVQRGDRWLIDQAEPAPAESTVSQP